MARAWLDKNESPRDVPEELKQRILELAKSTDFARYEGPYLDRLRDKLAAVNSVGKANLVLGSGSDECILILCLAFGGPGTSVAIPSPTFVTYRDAAAWSHSAVVDIPRLTPDFAMDTGRVLEAVARADASCPPEKQFASIAFVCRPNNPTAGVCPEEDVKRLLAAPRCLVVVDEAYHEFSGLTLAPWIKTYPNILILRTFSKAYSIAGLRVGYAIAPEPLAKAMERRRLPFNISLFSQLSALVVLQEEQYFLRWARELRQACEDLQSRLSLLPGVSVWPSSTNFVLFATALPAARVHSLLQDRGIMVRHYPDEPLLADHHLRVSVGSPQANAAFLQELASALHGASH
jgi:histidinol-phosphate aminotransferase